MAYNPNMYMPQGYQANAWNQPLQAPVNGLISVNGINGAKAYQMPPNSAIALFDANEDMMYIKTTDAAGYPTIKTFRFEAAENPEQAPAADYVSKDDFAKLAKQVDSIADKLKKVVVDAE